MKVHFLVQGRLFPWLCQMAKFRMSYRTHISSRIEREVTSVPARVTCFHCLRRMVATGD